MIILFINFVQVENEAGDRMGKLKQDALAQKIQNIPSKSDDTRTRQVNLKGGVKKIRSQTPRFTACTLIAFHCIVEIGNHFPILFV
jgi:hypothetical protein